MTKVSELNAFLNLNKILRRSGYLGKLERFDRRKRQRNDEYKQSNLCVQVIIGIVWVRLEDNID